MAAGGFLARLGEGCGGGCWSRMPWALVPRAAQVKAFLHLVVEHSCFGGPFSFCLKLCTKFEQNRKRL